MASIPNAASVNLSRKLQVNVILQGFQWLGRLRKYTFFFAPARGNQTVGTLYQGVVITVNHQHPVIRKKRKEMSRQYIFTFVTSKSGTVIPHAVICNALIQNLSS